jgi:hypothetical protein
MRALLVHVTVRLAHIHLLTAASLFLAGLTDYVISAHGRVVLEGSVESFETRHAIRRLESGSVEISVWSRACVVTQTGVQCGDIDYQRW